MHLDFDPSLDAVVDCVRQHNTPIQQALTDGRRVDILDLAALQGSVSALLDAIDARLAPVQAEPVKAVA